MKRVPLLVISFGTGLIADFFFITPGLHAAACSLIGYLRPFIINLLLPKEQTDWGSEEPNRKTMGTFTYIFYLTMMTLSHHAYLILLEWMQFGNFGFFIGKLLATTIISLLLVSLADLFVSRNTRTR
jgi:hypothetical protein